MKELLTEIKSRNIKAKAWMEENPGSWSGMYSEDEAYWIERGITNLVELERDELATYIYEGHKDAYGTKGRHYDFEAMTTQELKSEADRISVAVNEQMELEAKWEAEAVSKFETSIKKYMDMFETVLGGDEDELNRQKYLQLAQFGTNLLAQPGGDLTAAVGRAAAPSVAELGKIQARERAADREIKALGLQAAMKQLDPTRLEQTVRYLQKEMPGVSTEKLINMAISGSTGKGSTQEDRIQFNTEALSENLTKEGAAKAARGIDYLGRNFAEFSELPVDKNGKINPDTPDGLYYDKKGNLSIIDKGVKSDLKIGSTKISSK